MNVNARPIEGGEGTDFWGVFRGERNITASAYQSQLGVPLNGFPVVTQCMAEQIAAGMEAQNGS